jgi:hypothetical protein
VGALLLLALVLRQITPWLARRASDAEAADRERPYRATRAIYTRRAFVTDRVAEGDTSAASTTGLAAAPPGISLWDPAALLRALGRDGTARGAGIAWQGWGDTLIAVVPLPPAPAAVLDAQRWGVARVLAAASGTRGAPASAPGGREDATIAPPLVMDTTAAPVVISDTLGAVAAPALDGFWPRLAFAWSLQNYGLLGDGVPQPDPRIVVERDVRARVRRLVPFLAQGRSVSPMVDGDSLIWMLDLYATSRTYPLSQPIAVGEREVRYARHAATALINAHTGRVTLVATATPDPIATTWLQLVPRAFTPPASLPLRVADALPPAIDGARAEAEALSTAGSRDPAAPRGGHLPRLDGGDAALAGPDALFALARTPAALGWTVPVLDAEERVVGVVLATGGRERLTRWLAVSGERRRWTAILDSLRRAGDVPPSTGSDARVVRGPVRAVPLAGGIAFVQTSYTLRADGTPLPARVAVLLPDGSVRSGASVFQALGAATPASPTPAAPLTPATFEARVRELYAEMRRALSRGDWAAFGAAYSALGELLDAPAPPRP